MVGEEVEGVVHRPASVGPKVPVGVVLCEVLCECLSSGLEGVVELLLEP